ncbi:LPS export ABC transporter periplasmic protein LptC [Bartonella rochalimae]|uniref:LPS export ABC transporter periplasmic protein LptC n=1 Tax=Bartonella rochalimae TaxID=395923 RepID=UPI003F682256
MTVRNQYEFFSIESSFTNILKKTYFHSRKVRLLKICLPFLALIIALIFCWFTFFSISFSFDKVLSSHEEEEIAQLTMLNPRLEGYTNFHKPYWIKAEKAFQDRKSSGIIGLKNITAEVPTKGQGQIFIDAQGGVYDNIKSHLQFNEPFTVTTKDGIIAKFIAANIDLSKSQFNTDRPVDIQSANFHLIANALQVCEKEQVMYFQKGVRIVLDKKEK